MARCPRLLQVAPPLFEVTESGAGGRELGDRLHVIINHSGSRLLGVTRSQGGLRVGAPGKGRGPACAQLPRPPRSPPGRCPVKAGKFTVCRAVPTLHDWHRLAPSRGPQGPGPHGLTQDRSRCPNLSHTFPAGQEAAVPDSLSCREVEPAEGHTRLAATSWAVGFSPGSHHVDSPPSGDGGLETITSQYT